MIKFFASWCRACKAMSPKIDSISDEWPEVEFYEIMFDNNKKLCKSLGIKVLPFIEIVAGTNGKVESFSCGPSKISQLQVRKVDRFTDDRCACACACKPCPLSTLYLRLVGRGASALFYGPSPPFRFAGEARDARWLRRDPMHQRRADARRRLSRRTRTFGSLQAVWTMVRKRLNGVCLRQRGCLNIYTHVFG